MTLITEDILKKALSTGIVIDELKLDYQSILRVDNLWRFTSLTKLQLENNRITKIEGLGALDQLRWLDLSFNEITEIEGLDSLTLIRTLSLHSNKIREIRNMDHLSELSLFSIGHNCVECFDQLVYLRQFENLKCLCFEGNSVNGTTDYKHSILVRLPNLEYLDYEIVRPEMVNAAENSYGWMVKEAKEREEKQKRERIRSKEEREKGELYRAAFIGELFEENVLEEFILQPCKLLFTRQSETSKQLQNEMMLLVREIMPQAALKYHEDRLEKLTNYENEVHTQNEKTHQEILHFLEANQSENIQKHEMVSNWKHLNELEATRGDRCKILTTKLLENLSENLFHFNSHYANLIGTLIGQFKLYNQELKSHSAEEENDTHTHKMAQMMKNTEQKLKIFPQNAQDRGLNWFQNISEKHRRKEICRNRFNVALFV